jgi:hypothetical protein
MPRTSATAGIYRLDKMVACLMAYKTTAKATYTVNSIERIASIIAFILETWKLIPPYNTANY